MDRITIYSTPGFAHEGIDEYDNETTRVRPKAERHCQSCDRRVYKGWRIDGLDTPLYYCDACVIHRSLD